MFIARINADATLGWVTYLVGNSMDIARAVAVDDDGNVCVAGSTRSTNFVTTDGVYMEDPIVTVAEHAFATKLSSSGVVVWSTYFARVYGGTETWNGWTITYRTDHFTGYAVDVDSDGFVYLAGGSAGVHDASGGSPPAPPPDLKHVADVFVGKLNPDGAFVAAKWDLGGTLGTGQETARGLVVDADGLVHVSGWTGSSDFPTLGAYDSTHNGGLDAFYAKLPSSLGSPVNSTYLGGAADDQAFALALDLNAKVYLTGSTQSTNFPTTAGVVQPALNGPASDAFATQLVGATLGFSTYFGGTSADIGYGIAVDDCYDVAIVGETMSSDLPVHDAFQPLPGGVKDGFLTQIGLTGTTLERSTYIGGMAEDAARAVDLDHLGAVYLTGYTASFNFPLYNPLQPVHGGARDAFGAKLPPAHEGAVDLEIYKPKVIDPAEPMIPANLELTKGAQTFVNIDNDDNDGLFDNSSADTEIPGGDDEMVKIKLKVSTTLDPNGTVTLTIPHGSSGISIWNSNTNFAGGPYAPGTPIPLNQFTVEGGFRVKTMWVNGGVASTRQQQVRLQLNYKALGALPAMECSDQVALTVIGINKIEWSGDGNSLNDDNYLTPEVYTETWPAGMEIQAFRVFPDARITNVVEVEATPRDRVWAEVALSVKPVDPVVLYFRSFDVDDPTSKVTPVDDPASRGIVGNDSVDEDNRGEAPALAGVLIGQDAEGIRAYEFDAKVESLEFQVTMQPGDNFRVAGNGDRDYLLNLVNPDNYVTAWHVVNPGGAVAENNDKQRILHNGPVNAGLSPVLSEIRESNKYASPTLVVWRFLNVERDHMAAPAAGTGGPFDGEVPQAVDDPRPTADLNDPGINLMELHYRPAFIEVVALPETFNIKRLISFVHNVADGTEVAVAGPQRDQSSLDRFWVVQIVGAYEGPADQDIDPLLVADDPAKGTRGGVSNPFEGDGPCMVYLETLRDYRLSYPNFPLSLELLIARIALHESAHRMGMPKHGTPPGDEGPLSGDNNISANEALNNFTPPQLDPIPLN